MNQVEEVIQWLFEEDAREMKKICNKEMMHFGGISEMDYDDFYSQVGWDISLARESFDPTRGKTFKDYIYGVIKLSVWKEMKRRNCSKRQIIVEKEITDNEGNVIIEKEYIPTTSLDAPIGDEDGGTLSDYLYSDRSVENEVFGEVYDEKVELFLKELPNSQRKIIELKMNQHTSDEIKQILNISDREYNSAMKSIQMNENLSLFTKNINDCNYKEETEMERVMEINEADNYRMDKRSMFSLLEDKKSGDINCKYILQRKPFQWTQEERNRYICRILSNLPIPEIILCEQNIKGLMIDHLIDGLQRLSYAEAFKENRFKVGANGAERHLIKYREFVLDENGNRVLDEDGIPIYEEKICDVVGKHYKDLPDELKKRFNNFNVNVTKFFNCTDEQIADHIRDYNNHASMNNEQLGMTKISADTARKIKAISEKNTFFKNCGKFTDNTTIKGKLDKIVSESIMLLFHRNEWKSKIDKTYQFIDENVTDEEFLGLNSDLNRLEIAIGEEDKETKEMFTVANTPMWLAVFHEFTTYNMEDSRFVDFLGAYNNELNKKEIDGVSMSDFKDMQSKKKATITGKIELLVKLMREYLHIDSTDLVEVDYKEFLKGNVEDIIDSDIEEIQMVANDISEEIDEDSWMLSEQNYPAYLAIVGLAFRLDEEDTLKEWLSIYEKNNQFIRNQQEAFLHMKQSFEMYLQKGMVA